MYKIIFCDMDGTLMDSQNRLSEENINAIKKLAKKGVMFVPTTGRTLAEMPEVLAIDEIRYIIFSTGTALLDRKTGKTEILGIEKETVKLVADVLQRCDVYTVIHSDGKTFVDKSKEKEVENFGAGLRVLVETFAIAEEDLLDKLKKMNNVESVCLFFKEKAETEKCKEMLDKIPGLYASKGTWGLNIEAIHSDGGKDKGIQRLLERVGCSLSEVITVGDSYNDIDMTRIAGLALATENACQPMKDIAHEVICSNDEHVVEYIYNKFFK